MSCLINSPKTLTSQQFQNFSNFQYDYINDKNNVREFVSFVSEENAPLDYVINKSTPPLNSLDYKTPTKALFNNKQRGKYYQNISKDKETKRKDFAKYKWFLNNHTGEIIKFKNMSLENLLEKSSKQLQFAIQQIQHISNTDDSFFLTLTLPPHFHRTYKENGVKVVNKDFDDDLIQKGYKQLLKIQQILDRKFRKPKYLGHGLPYVRIIEPHKDFTSHLHIQLWLDKKDVEMVKDLILGTLNNQISLGNLGIEFDIKHITQGDDDKNISSYIVKYLLKTQEQNVGHRREKGNNDPRNLRSIDGWKRKNKIRMFSSSRLVIPKKHYNPIVNQAPEIDREIYDNLGAWAVDNVKHISIVNKLEMGIEKIHKIKTTNNPQTPLITIFNHTLKYNNIIYDEDGFETIEEKRKTLKIIFMKKENNVVIMAHNSKWWIMFEDIPEQSLKPTNNINTEIKPINNIHYNKDMILNCYDDKYYKEVYDNF